MVTNKVTAEHKLKLSIQVSLDGLSFCALSPAESKIIFFKDIVFGKRLNPVQVLRKIEKIYEEESFLKEHQPEVVVIFCNDLYSLVPEQFFEEEYASDYLKFNTRILENDYVAHDVLAEPAMVNVYVPFTNITNFFFDKYGEFEFRHSISVLSEAFLKLYHDEDSRTTVYLNCYPGGYDLVVIKKGKLLLANSFKCHTREDFIYYLLFTAEQLDLDPTKFELVLLGKITENSDYYQMAYTYVKDISFLAPQFGYTFEGKGEAPKGNFNFTLLKALQ